MSHSSGYAASGTQKLAVVASSRDNGQSDTVVSWVSIAVVAIEALRYIKPIICNCFQEPIPFKLCNIKFIINTKLYG